MSEKKLESIIVATMELIGNQSETTVAIIIEKVMDILCMEYDVRREKLYNVMNEPISEDIDIFISNDYIKLELIKESLDHLSNIKKCFKLITNGYVETFIMNKYPEFIKKTTYDPNNTALIDTIEKNNPEPITSKRSIGFCRDNY